MIDRPILFSAPMVRALLDGRKQQTRRILKDQPGDIDKPGMFDDGEWYVTDSRGGHQTQLAVRFRKGDRLYVREHWRTESKAYDDLKPSEMDADYPVIFEADGDWKANKTVGRFRQGMHMPRWASRLTLTVTDVRVQRLQDCSMDDAAAEGLRYIEDGPGAGFWVVDGTTVCSDGSVEAYAQLWDVINGDGAWDANPWIVALTFSVERRNIDATRAA